MSCKYSTNSRQLLSDLDEVEMRSAMCMKTRFATAVELMLVSYSSKCDVPGIYANCGKNATLYFSFSDNGKINLNASWVFK